MLSRKIERHFAVQNEMLHRDPRHHALSSWRRDGSRCKIGSSPSVMRRHRVTDDRCPPDSSNAVATEGICIPKFMGFQATPP
jgi:hypothetical protein